MKLATLLQLHEQGLLSLVSGGHERFKNFKKSFFVQMVSAQLLSVFCCHISDFCAVSNFHCSCNCKCCSL